MCEVNEGAESGFPRDSKVEVQRHELLTPSMNGGIMELWSTLGGVAAGVVLETDNKGEPIVWESFDGSLWQRDSSGDPMKIRGKWD